MAQSIDSVSCGNQYTGAATLQDIYAANPRGPFSNGGFFNVTSNDAFAQLQWFTANGQSSWTPEFHVPTGPYTLSPGTTGIRFRNYVAGLVAIVSAGIFFPAQPALTSAGSGSVSVSGSLTGITGIVSSAGAVVGGTGFAVAHPGVGQFTITFTTAFAAVPTVVASFGSTTNNFGAAEFVVVAALATTGFNIGTFNAAGVAADQPFTFIALTTV